MKNSRPVMVAVVLTFVLTFLSGCGKQHDLVLHSEVRTIQEGENVYAQWVTQLDLGRLQMPSLSIPVVHPKNPELWLGDLSLRAGFNGATELAVTLDAEALFDPKNQEGTHDAFLPNGSPIPVGGLGDVPILNLKAGSRSRVYAAIGEGEINGVSYQVAMLGVAVVIQEFDGIGNSIQIPLNLFPRFQIQDGVMGVAGIFTSTQASQSGLAVFVDAGQALFNPEPDGRLSNDQTLISSSLMASSVTEIQNPLYFRTETVSNKNRDRVDEGLYRLHRKRTRLHVK